MSQDYTKYKCITHMRKEYQERLFRIVEEYAPRLNSIQHDGGTVYTFHDFDHHCCDLYYIVSDIILYQQYAFGKGEGALTDTELYILNLAILLHDIGMTKLIDLVRDNHSVESVKIVRKAYYNSSDPLTEAKSGLSKNELDALCLVIQAHSDVKDGSVPAEKNGLRNPGLTNNHPDRPHNIRARFLANILRFADELDVTTDRLGNYRVIDEFEEAVRKRQIIEQKLRNIGDSVKKLSNEDERKGLEKELDRYKAAEQSLRFWKKLSYFRNIERDSTGCVKLCTDDNEIADIISRDSNEDMVINDICEVYDKILKEFVVFNEDISSDLQLGTMVAIKKLELSSGNADMEEKLKKKQQEQNAEIIEADRIYPHVISTRLEDDISEFIEKKGLFNVGHYRIHDNLCARDWIMVNEIVMTGTFFKECEKQILLHISKLENLKEHYLIIGIDFYGMLVASRLSFILHKPYDYLIPKYKKGGSSCKEVNLDVQIDQYEDIIIITDVISTYKTIKDLMEAAHIQEKVRAIYAILFRNTTDRRFIEESRQLAEKTYVLNSKYPIEIMDNSSCRYRDDIQKCKASNKTYF